MFIVGFVLKRYIYITKIYFIFIFVIYISHLFYFCEMNNIFTPEMGELKDILPSRIKEARKSARLTQQGLADIIGVDRSIISRLETKPSNITVETLEKIAKACNVSIFKLVSKD